jgi:hypothetical protein
MTARRQPFSQTAFVFAQLDVGDAGLLKAEFARPRLDLERQASRIVSFAGRDRLL